jgi:hypothetical protein
MEVDFGDAQAFDSIELEGTLDVDNSMVIVPSNAKTLPNDVETIFFSNDPSAMIASIVVIKIYFVITCVDVIIETSIRSEELDTFGVTIPSTFGAPKTIGLIAIKRW